MAGRLPEEDPGEGADTAGWAQAGAIWDSFCFALGVFIGGPVSLLLRFYCIFNYSIHFTLEWLSIQVLTMAQVA